MNASRTLALLRGEGYVAATAEKFVRFPPPGHRVDLWGFVDIMAYKPNLVGTLAVQVTDAPGLADHREKILKHENVPGYLSCRNRLEIHAWRKVGAAGRRKVYEPHIERFYLENDEVKHAKENVVDAGTLERQLDICG